MCNRPNFHFQPFSELVPTPLFFSFTTDIKMEIKLQIVFVQIANCFCSNCKLYLFKLQIVFVQLTKKITRCGNLWVNQFPAFNFPSLAFFRILIFTFGQIMLYLDQISNSISLHYYFRISLHYYFCISLNYYFLDAGE